jgi:hypothetical protein
MIELDVVYELYLVLGSAINVTFIRRDFVQTITSLFWHFQTSAKKGDSDS